MDPSLNVRTTRMKVAKFNVDGSAIGKPGPAGIGEPSGIVTGLN